MSSTRSPGGFSILGCIFLAPFLTGCNERNPKAEALPPPMVLVAKPIERDVTDHKLFTARTQAVQSVDVKARVTGYLTKINFKDGSEVKQGEVLFEIDDRPYKAALDKAVAMVETTKAGLVKATADFDIADKIRKQDPNALSLQDLTKTIGARDEAKGNLDSAKAGLESATLNYGWCKVTSPIDGLASTHFIDVGNIVNADTSTLTNVVSLKPMWVYFNVDQNTALDVQDLVKDGKIKGVRESNLPVEMSVTSDGAFTYKGETDFYGNQLDPNTGTVRARAVFPNEDKKLWSGMFGRVKVPFGAEHKALLVNDRAIGVNQGQKFLLVVGADNKVEIRMVETGMLHDGLREVITTRTVKESDKDGKPVIRQVEVLKPGDRVIVEGLQRVRPGAVVSPSIVDMATLMPEAKTEKQSTK